MTRAIFLDRDDLLIAASRKKVSFSKSRNHPVMLLPGVVDGLRGLATKDFKFVVVSNQPSIALGWHTVEMFNSINAEINRQLQEAGAPRIFRFYYCAHRPETKCECKKPSPGLLRSAASDLGIDLSSSYMLGDERGDVGAGVAAGVRHSFLVWQVYVPFSNIDPKKFTRVKTFDAAADIILKWEKETQNI